MNGYPTWEQYLKWKIADMTRFKKGIAYSSDQDKPKEIKRDLGYLRDYREDIDYGRIQKRHAGLVEEVSKKDAGFLDYGRIAKKDSGFLDYGRIAKKETGFLDYGKILKRDSGFLDYGRIAKKDSGILDYGRISKKDAGLLDYGRISKKGNELLDYGRISKKDNNFLDYGRIAKKDSGFVDYSRIAKKDNNFVDYGRVAKKESNFKIPLNPSISASDFTDAIQNSQFRQRMSRLKSMLQNFNDFNDKSYPNFLYTRRGRSQSQTNHFDNGLNLILRACEKLKKHQNNDELAFCQLVRLERLMGDL